VSRLLDDDLSFGFVPHNSYLVYDKVIVDAAYCMAAIPEI